MLQRRSALPLSAQLADRLSERIKDRLLPAGSRLPSVRQCAAQNGVSAATVVAAYDLLVARGLVQAQPQRGFFVRSGLAEFSNDFSAKSAVKPAQAAIESIANFAPLPAPVSATSLIRRMFAQRLAGQRSPDEQPGMGVLPRAWLQNEHLPRALRQVATTRGVQELALQYGDPQGDLPLRQALAARLADLNVNATPGQIITTVGATHALDIASRCLLKPGDAVLVEEPGWAVEFARLAAMGMRLLPVPRGPDGPDLQVMAALCAAHAPKLFVSVSVLHNPTGACLSPASAHQVLQLAQKHQFYVLEDDTYSHLAPSAATRMAALDGLCGQQSRVIYISGFAKVLAPNWRVGFMAAPQHLVERLTDTKMLSTLTTPALTERALALYIEKGQLRRHSKSVRSQLASARSRVVKLAHASGCTFAAEPAGLFGWVDVGLDTDRLAQRMLDHGVLLAPGSLFHATHKPSSLMRINFATSQDAALWRLMAKERAALLG